METTEKNNSMNAQNSFKHLTVTIIFDGNALNRDEKIAGNITGIKKLSYNGEVRSFISKYAIRHYLFETLVKSKNWSKDAKLIASGSGDKKVIQFDITQSDILNNEEMDCFGYMYTEQTFTRKAPIGITKAISLYPYEQDMALYANHNLVKRSREQGQTDVQPNLFNKYEHASYYKVSFTIDTDILGKDTWLVKNFKDQNQNNELEISIGGNGKKIKYSQKQENENIIEYTIYNSHKLICQKIGNDLYKIEFLVNDKEKQKRICDILSVLKNGLYAQSSGESNTIIPLVFIAATVKVPSPIFHPYVDIQKGSNGKIQVIGINDGLNNDWVEKVYIQRCEKVNIDEEDNIKIIKEWNNFLKEAGLSNCIQNTQTNEP